VIFWACEMVRGGRDGQQNCACKVSAKIFLDSSTVWKTEIIQPDFSVCHFLPQTLLE